MDYMNVKEAAKKWNVGERRVQYYCANDKIPGAKSFGKQWVIPANAERPMDGRSKKAKQEVDLEPYHFPVYLFSPIYTNTMITLNEEEQSLAHIYELFASGEHIKCIEESKILFDATYNTTIKIGALANIAMCACLNILPKLYDKTIKQIKAIVDKEVLHKEDYKLIYAGILIHHDHNLSYYKTVNIQELSSEALPYSYYLLCLISMFKKEKFKVNEIISMEIYAKALEFDGDSPLLLALYGIIAVYKLDGKEDISFYIKRIGDMSIKHNWYYLLTKYYIYLSEYLNTYFSKVNPEAIKKTMDLSLIIHANFKIHTKLYNMLSPFEFIKTEDLGLFFLLSKDNSLETIAMIEDKSVEELNKHIQEICHNLNLNNLDELIDYAKKNYNDYLNEMDTK